MFFFKPRYSDVLTLSNELTEVLNALNLAGEGLVVMPIERINSLVVFSASSTLLKTVEGWIKKLDEEVETGQNIFVYPVQNVKATEIAEILKALYGETGTASPGIVPQRKQPAAAAKKPARAPRPTPVRRRARTGESISSRVEIITFEPTNSLVILAPPGIYREMIKTIKKIDTYPREVLIEAVIAEVSLSDSDEHGIQWSVLHNISAEGSDFKGLVEGDFGDPAPPLLSEAPTLSTGVGGFSYYIFKPDKLTALIRAIASESKVNILSSPRLLVRDQEEASIEVGSEIPTATSTTSTTTTETLTQNIEYKTVGIKLKIKPTISEEKTVVLDLEQEVSSTGEDQQVGQTGNLFPTFNTTKTKTSIVVPNEQGIVIGGIMEEEGSKGYQGIPLLSKIPLIGALFRYNVRSLKKKELLIIITPFVLADRSEADIITRGFIKQLVELKEFLIEKKSEVNIPSLSQPDVSEK
jgi:general secretion pathway protein D